MQDFTPHAVIGTASPALRCLRIALAGMLALIAAESAHALEEQQQPTAGAWNTLRANLYANEPIGIATDAFMSIDVPANTPDPAATPLGLRFGDEAKGRIKRLRVIIDNNPSPLAATFDIAPGTALNALDLRVRVDRYTSVRAIAETTDGKLTMRSGWVKASGGCSAPPSASEGGIAGEIRVRESTDLKSLLVSVRHPNHSGFQIDPKSGDAIPPHFIHQLVISAGGHALITAETGISLSENPSVRLALDQPWPGPITIEAADSRNVHFSTTWRAGASAATPSAAR